MTSGHHLRLSISVPCRAVHGDLGRQRILHVLFAEKRRPPTQRTKAKQQSACQTPGLADKVAVVGWSWLTSRLRVSSFLFLVDSSPGSFMISSLDLI